MLSGVGAHATTQSKHPGAAGCHNANPGSSTEIAHSDTLLERKPGENSAFFTASILGMFRLRDAVIRASLRVRHLKELLRQQIREPGEKLPARACAGQTAIKSGIENQVGFQVVSGSK
jgi:hypothetical protein